jgi:acyl-CoA synthetase (AMP-forming)/AMP-acid ligase II
MMSHLNMVTACESVVTYLENTEDDVLLCVLPLSFGYGLNQVLTSTKVGGTVVLEKGFTFPAVVVQRLRSERVERTFAHVCETGGARRTWLHGIDKLRKRYSIAAAAHNLGCLMRALFQMGTPRALQAFADLLSFAQIVVQSNCRRFQLQLRQLPIAFDSPALAA